jgi:hypothetical protein
MIEIQKKALNLLIFVFNVENIREKYTLCLNGIKSR